MPKGMPGEDKPGQLARKIEQVNSEIRNEVAAKKFPMLMKALGNLPPTRGEIEMVRLFGYPEGFIESGRESKWTKTRTRKGSAWNLNRKSNGDSSEESGQD